GPSCPRSRAPGQLYSNNWVRRRVVAVRRGVVLVIVLILAAVVASAAGLICHAVLATREPPIVSNSTLVLRVNGDLQEIEPAGVLGQFFEAPATVRSIVEALRK